MILDTAIDKLSPRSSTEETRFGEEDVEVDWVLAYDFDDLGTEHKDLESAGAVEEFRTLIHHLENRGLQTQVRHGYGQSLLVLIRVPRNLLGNEVYRSRVKDWLHGIIATKPVGDSKTVVKSDTPAEALRSVYHLVTWTHAQGGAGITPGHGDWERITSSYPPQDTFCNRKLLKHLAGKSFLKSEDLDQIRALFGEKVAFYYAFIQCYSLFLILPTACGVLTWLFSGPYSPTFAFFTCLWGVIFVEYWKREEIDLSIRWDVRGVGHLKVNRPQYVWEREEKDPVTGEVKQIFPTHKRILRQLWFLPFAALASIALGTVLLVTFAVEALMSDVYGDILEERWYLQYFPTIILSVALPYMTDGLTELATKLTEYENYRTKDEFDLAQVQKSFVLNFITSFFPLVLTAYIYIPYGARLLPLLIPSTWDTKNVVNSFDVDPGRLQEEVISLSMAAQAINFGEEFLYPFLKRKAMEFWRKHTRQRRAASFEQSELKGPEETRLFDDKPGEAQLLERLRREYDADEYDVNEDIMEMVVQFGYLTLFAPAWPLMPLGFLMNNWVELRGDFFKLSSESQRPPPVRADSIGDSISALEFLTWLGTLSTAALVHIYRGPGSISETRPSRLLLTIFLAEQVYLAVRISSALIFKRFGSVAVKEAEAKTFMMRKTYLETFSEEKAGTSRRVRSRTYAGQRRPSQLMTPGASTPATPGGEKSPVKELEKQLPSITVNGEEGENAPEFDSEYGNEAAERFWTESPEVYETAEVGVRLITALKAWAAKDKGGAKAGDSRNKAD